MLGAIIAVEGTSAISATQIDHLTQMLAPLTDEVMLLGGAESGAQHRQVSVPRGASELAAVAQVLAHADGDHVMVLAADLRWPSPDLLRYMALIRAGHEAVVPEDADGDAQPMLAIYHSRIAGRARGLAGSGERDLAALLKDVLVRRVSSDELAKFGDPTQLLRRGPT